MGFFGPDGKSSLIQGCYTSSEVPGKKIKRNLGAIQYTQKDVADDLPSVSDAVIKAIMEAARKKGANAVLNMQVVTGSYGVANMGVNNFLMVYGDAVVLE